ncbi:Re/Si-specific NAD(P)(+) transhydrogenase subunit alpha [Enterobacteriaceae endosymbiont of Neohaemonia nigricornis]|uniref:Re/Si-specific NAD(P)(+) transhydrogenase subunit alpha n=1 Tax=Enterobacteriaceae endosymbiont of Neohaemonia nigricornis TaxID=2675792 RepID=UPI001448D0D8|nr:Re/Si-specific NAD(P)(+) transhydrogenase subunit alpha [Enterobacteriaceae endosymbiont of Neohaemonia nigricornis]QJC30274.1 Re/Si-specific NAD(P)(+) transhydrogenase subunit alpha [Enterobacteriaceae endosymbiont of Neohaemonia nigricornis]
MLIGVPKETFSKENRIAIIPTAIPQLIKLGFNVYVEKDAGNKSFFQNQDFIDNGATIVDNHKIWNVDIIIKINPPNQEEINLIKSNTILISLIWPIKNYNLLKVLALKNITTFAMDYVPRISRAQYIDVLSSMSNLAGYRSVIEAIYLLAKPLNSQITAAGKIQPAKVMIIGAGVAGLSAIATAKSLGALVVAYDPRKEVKEQINSMGAKFLELKNNTNVNMVNNNLILDKAIISNELYNTDIIITTASIPNKKSPILIDKQMLNKMKAGSIIIDLAIENGGNCELTEIDKIITTNNNVKIVGITNISSKVQVQASKLYSNNMINFIKLISKDHFGHVNLNSKDDIINHMLVTYKKKITLSNKKVSITPTINKKSVISKSLNNDKQIINSHVNKSVCNNKLLLTGLYVLSFILITYISKYITQIAILHIIIFILSCIIGYYVVWNVNHKLHTPLMSVTNAISGIIIIGVILQIKNNLLIVNILSFISILVSSINIFGGLTITKRMLTMFCKN